MYKTVNKKAPDYLSGLFTKSNNDYDTRGKENRLLFPKFRTEFAKRNCFSFTEEKVWNSIPFKVSVKGIRSTLSEADGSKADSLLTFWTRLSALDKNSFHAHFPS